jgi:hypothetical protein
LSSGYKKRFFPGRVIVLLARRMVLVNETGVGARPCVCLPE